MLIVSSEYADAGLAQATIKALDVPLFKINFTLMSPSTTLLVSSLDRGYKEPLLFYQIRL